MRTHRQLGLVVRSGDLALSRKNMPFCTFFHMQPKYQNGAIFVNIESFRPSLSKPSYGAPQWGLMVRLLQEERLKSPQKSPFRKPGLLGHFGHLGGEIGHFGRVGRPILSQDGRREENFHLGSGLDQ